MTNTCKSVAAFCGLLGVLCACVPSPLRAQAPPGPLPPRQSPDTESAPPPPPSAPTPPRAPKEKPAPRQNISGYWNLNRDGSDNARTNIDQARVETRRSPSSTNPGGGNGPYGGGPIGGGGPLGGGGYPFPGGGGNGPYGGGRRNPNGGYPGDSSTTTDSEEQAPAMQEYIYPATGVTFVIKDAEVDLSDDSARRRVFYTDGRKLAKPDKNDNNYREIAAHWEGTRLVSEEKSPAGEQVHRTFELSPDGRQLDENITLDATRSRSAVMIHYVYDINTNRQ